MRSNHHFSCVVTIALKQELPIDWVRSLGYRIVTLEGALSGDLFRAYEGPSVLFFITGVGANKSKMSAEFIRDNIAPDFVLNWGTAGNINHNYSLGDIIIPTQLSQEDGPNIEHDCRMPLCIESYDLPIVGGDLYSSLNRSPIKLNASFIDMEAYFQADIFNTTDISFHVIKTVSDYADSLTEKVFMKGLELTQKNFRHIFKWLELTQSDFDICVVIPTYNRESTIERAIDSVLAQSYKVSDIIVVDDASTDCTMKILDSYKKKIVNVPSQSNRGVSFSRNLGVQHSQCSWIAFLDSDDEWFPSKLDEQVNYIKKHPYLSIMQCNEQWLRNGKSFNKKKHHAKKNAWIFDLCLERCSVSPSGVLMSRDIFNKYLGFDDKLPVCEDYALWLQISRFHIIGLLDKPLLTKYGGHKDQLSVKYEVMDTFRVKALLGILDNEKVDCYKEKLIAVLSQKIRVLLNGYKKRSNWEQVQYYENVLERIRDMYYTF